MLVTPPLLHLLCALHVPQTMLQGWKDLPKIKAWLRKAAGRTAPKPTSPFCLWVRFFHELTFARLSKVAIR
jgi:hypothetical protein